VVITVYAAAWPKVIETGIGTALMCHLAREEIYYILMSLLSHVVTLILPFFIFSCQDSDRYCRFGSGGGCNSGSRPGHL